jgi:hypothetical protein
MPGQGKVFTITTPVSKPIRVLGDNAERGEFSIKNSGTTIAYYGYDQEVATSGYPQGWPIAASGGSITNARWQGEVWVICAAAVALTVEEINGPTRVIVVAQR